MSIDRIEHVGKTDTIEEVTKFNPYHGKDGRFASKNGGGAGAGTVAGNKFVGSTGGKFVDIGFGQWRAENDNGSNVIIHDLGQSDSNMNQYGSRHAYIVEMHTASGQREQKSTSTKAAAMKLGKEFLKEQAKRVDHIEE